MSKESVCSRVFFISLQLFPDIFCRREILSFRVHCGNFAEGCSWEGDLIDLDVSAPNLEDSMFAVLTKL